MTPIAEKIRITDDGYVVVNCPTCNAENTRIIRGAMDYGLIYCRNRNCQIAFCIDHDKLCKLVAIHNLSQPD